MVILSVAITTKNGKALLARQYREMSRIRIEGLLSAFPKLANTRTTSDKQHTFVETDSVRYVYQPLETVFVLLVTTKSSNIVEDLDTLQLLTRLVKDQVPAIDEGKIVDKAFELFFAFDEIISIGYAENLSVENVRTFLDMDSQEENLENILTRTKIDDAIAFGKRRAAQIAKQKAAAAKSKEGTGVVPTTTESYQFSGGIGSSAKGTANREESRMGSFGGQSQEYSEPKNKKPTAPMMSLKPKKKGTTSSLLKEMVKEGEVEATDVEDKSSPSEEVEAPAPSVGSSGMKVENVHVKIEEKISAEMGREGGVSKVDIKGEMYLTVTDPKVANLRVIMNPDHEERFQPKTHPNLDKKLFTDSSVLGVKSTSKKGFPTNTALKVLTWKLQTTDADGIVPLTVSCWPNQGEGLSASVEYELHRTDIELHNVSIIIPLPTDKVNVDQVECGSYKVDHKNNQLIWTLEAIDSSNASGTLEFSLPSADENSIFPITVNFTSPSTLSRLEVKDIVSAEDSKPVKHSNQTSLVSGEYMTV